MRASIIAILGLAICVSGYSSPSAAEQASPKKKHQSLDSKKSPSSDAAELHQVTSLTYRIMLLNDDGTESPVDEDKHTFQKGDQFRLIVESDRDLYTYVFHEDSLGMRSFLVPDRDDPKGYVPRLKKGKSRTIPRDGYFEVTPPGGIERVLVFATPQKRPELTEGFAIADPSKLSQTQRMELKRVQDRVFQNAMNIQLEQDSRPKQSGPRKTPFRLRALNWNPKGAGKRVVVGSRDKDAKPDLFVSIKLSSGD